MARSHRNNSHQFPVMMTLILIMTATFLQAGVCPFSIGNDGFGIFNQAPEDIVIDGTLAYTADLYGLTIYDITDPAAPAWIGQFLLPEGGQALTVASKIAYVADGQSGLAIIDVSDPSSPQLLSLFNTRGEARAVVAMDDLVVVADGSAGVTSIDVSDPEHPLVKDVSGIPGESVDLVVGGDHLYVTALGSGVTIYTDF